MIDRVRGFMLALALVACAERGGDDDEGDAITPRMTAVGNEAGISLDSATIARIGLETAALMAATRRPEMELAGVVVADPAAGATIRAGITGRLTVPEGADWPSLGEALAAGQAIAQIGDARPVTVPRRGSVAAIHAYPGEIVQAGQPLLELVDYNAPLVRVAWDGQGEPPASLLIAPASGGPRRSAARVGPAPSADPLTASPAWLYRLAGVPLRPGTAVTVFAPQAAGNRNGVLIPNRAVVQWDALPWAYVERAPGTYVRVRVPASGQLPEGWLAESGFRPGDRVVVTGAGLLLSEEFRARIVVGEEVGE